MPWLQQALNQRPRFWFDIVTPSARLGKPRSAEDRIFQYMEIRRPKKNGGTLPNAEPKPHAEDTFVISLGEKTKIRTDGVSAILGLLEWRYELAETVLFHRTKLAAGAMLDRALYELWERADEKELVNRLLPLSDDELLDEAIKEASDQRASSSNQKPNLDAAISLLQKLRDRALFKELATFDGTNLPHPHIPSIMKTYAGLEAATRAGAKHRAETARLLEGDFNLPHGSIAIYCSHVQPKIAQVSIDVDGEILTFSEYEKKHKNRLSGGHLEAQMARFGYLSRIYFFIDAQVRKSLSKERLLVLQQSIEDVILPTEEQERLIQRAKEKALAYVQQEARTGNNGIEFVDELITAAKGDPSVVGQQSYPNGAPRIRTFIRQR